MDLMIWSKVLERYPKTYKEQCCRMEKVRLSGLRAAYYERLINEQNSDSGESVQESQEAGEAMGAAGS